MFGKKKIFSFICILFLFATNSYAYTNIPKDFINEVVNDAKEILDQPDSNIEKKMVKLSKIATEVVDINGIGYYSLGKHRKNISVESLERYLDLFEKYFLKSFSSRLVVYTNPQIDVIGEEVLSPKYTIVNSILKATDDRPEVKIDWRVYTKNPDRILIRDVIIEGLSLARTQKEEFNSVIENNNGDIAKLFATIEEFISK